METARETLKRNNVEIDLGDHRSAEEIVAALGLTAVISDTTNQPNVRTRTSDSPYFVQ
jgi:hypothetical protein